MTNRTDELGNPILPFPEGWEPNENYNLPDWITDDLRRPDMGWEIDPDERTIRLLYYTYD
jgi:hypothetical protein